ncbi:unnamed protein product [Auanema sp. JU1783]|nr:unnamed protein product [Auanema sp. JU1783]
MSILTKFVPKFKAVDPILLKKFQNELGNIEKLVVLTGAGISTESGIPDYRSEEVGLYERSNHRPTTHQDFMKHEHNRRRYWARNYLAWPRFSSAECNKIHYSIANWEGDERLLWLITQNVDGLHTKAGSQKLTELHGSGHRVRCMGCGTVTSRHDFQEVIADHNPGWFERHTVGELAPDGDVFITPGSDEDFIVPNCAECGGIVKTDVVFFGDNVPRQTVDFLYGKMDECDGLLVLGSSLSVMSGYRFAYHAHLQNKPVLIINIGATRADHLACVKLSTKAGDVIKII